MQLATMEVADSGANSILRELDVRSKSVNFGSSVVVGAVVPRFRRRTEVRLRIFGRIDFYAMFRVGVRFL
jgi:hypothetical protein